MSPWNIYVYFSWLAHDIHCKSLIDHAPPPPSKSFLYFSMHLLMENIYPGIFFFPRNEFILTNININPGS